MNSISKFYISCLCYSMQRVRKCIGLEWLINSKVTIGSLHFKHVSRQFSGGKRNTFKTT